MTSFTPFVIVFIHPIAAAGEEDISLLRSIVEILGGMQDASTEMKRLHQICAAFAHTAERFVESMLSPVEAYNRQEDLLPFSGDAARLSIFQPEFLPELFGTDVFDQQAQVAMDDVFNFS